MNPASSAAPAPRASAGLATLPILLLLLMATLLAAAWAQRSVLNEIRSASLQFQHVVAFEAAEAGLAWTQTLLDSGLPLGDDCRAATHPAVVSTFRSRFIEFAPGTDGGDPEIVLRDRGAAAGEPVLACVRSALGWRCACPRDASPAPELGRSGAEPMPAFSVRLKPGATPGTLAVLVTGCSDGAQPCIGGASVRADANARMRHTLALLPVIATPPAAPLTVRGSITAPAGAALDLQNGDAASGGLAVHAGGTIDAPALRSTSVGGAAAAGDRIAGDSALAALSAEQLFQRHFGPPIDSWQRQSGVQRLECGTAGADCATQLHEQIEGEADVARIAFSGNLRLAGPMQLGSPARPLVLVVDGDLALDGAVGIHGLVYARNLDWRNAPSGGPARLQGAAILSGSFTTNGAPLLAYDAALIARLRTRAGSWVAIPGSWRDES